MLEQLFTSPALGSFAIEKGQKDRGTGQEPYEKNEIGQCDGAFSQGIGNTTKVWEKQGPFGKDGPAKILIMESGFQKCEKKYTLV